MSGKKLKLKPSASKELRGTQSTVGMSCDIKSLIDEFHQDTGSLKERVSSRGALGRSTTSNFVSLSSSIISSSKKPRYDPYDVTSIEKSPAR
jgi:hypothetical protein